MKKVIFNKKPENEVVYADSFTHLGDMNFVIGGEDSYDAKFIVIWDDQKEEYKYLSFPSLVSCKFEEYDDFDFFAFESTNELLEWLKETS